MKKIYTTEKISVNYFISSSWSLPRSFSLLLALMMIFGHIGQCVIVNIEYDDFDSDGVERFDRFELVGGDINIG